ncbi:Kinesin KIF2A [Brachionus plicatilis]|uniref:Kinesin KIF2A n=1 Tax=Brachionus plicatilis TaxID=10195 RepID=A0A3M7QBL4_BRAPC|nr:Kinesin KIF2A [Brachionus plicatilis]
METEKKVETIVRSSPGALSTIDAKLVRKFSFFLFYDCVCSQDKKQISKKDIDVITMPNKDQCLVHLPKCKVDLTKYLDNQKFFFDFAFDESTSNDLIYRIKNNIPHLYFFSELKFYAIYLNFLKN